MVRLFVLNAKMTFIYQVVKRFALMIAKEQMENQVNSIKFNNY